jgi:hypothetical protein
MNKFRLDVRIFLSIACLIPALAYGYAGCLLFLVFSCIFATLAVSCFIHYRFRQSAQKVLNGLHFYTLAGTTWLLLGLIYMSVFFPGRCFLSLLGKNSFRRSKGTDSSWEVVSTQTKRNRFERQF